MTAPASPAAEVAGKLSDLDRDALRRGIWNVTTFAQRFIALGICKDEPPHFISITPLGCEVRSLLKDQER